MRIVRSNKFAEEALQDSFKKTWTSASSFGPARGRPFTWMLDNLDNRKYGN